MLRDDGVSVRLNSIGADSLGRVRPDRSRRQQMARALRLGDPAVDRRRRCKLPDRLWQRPGRCGGDSDDAEDAEELARETIAQTFSDMANQALAENLQIPPTISVSQGERIFVYVRQDLDFSALYEIPSTEALKEIRRERGLRLSIAARTTVRIISSIARSTPLKAFLDDPGSRRDLGQSAWPGLCRASRRRPHGVPPYPGAHDRRDREHRRARRRRRRTSSSAAPIRS